MLKYFKIPYTEYNGFIKIIYNPEDLVQEVNEYADENNLEITSISTYEDKGLYVAFKKKC